MAGGTGFFSPEANLLGPWSPSKLGVIEQCSLKFKLQYTTKPSLVGYEVQTNDFPLTLGKGVHKYAELRHSSYPKDRASEEAYQEIPKTKGNLELIKSHSRGVDQYTKRIDSFLKKNKVVSDKVELRLAIGPDMTPKDFWDNSSILRGVLDRLIIIEKDGVKHAIAIDIKTGKRKLIEEFEDQLESYGLLVHGTHDVASVSSALFFTQTGDLDWYPRKALKSMVKNNPIISKIEGLAEKASKPPVPEIGRHCSWCKYRGLCEATARG